MPRRDHYLPAGLIGGFGRPHDNSPRRRRAKVCIRTRPPENKLTPEIKADSVAWDRGQYDVDNPTDDLPADWAEQIWQLYEDALPDAAKALEQPGFSPDDWATVLKHIRAAWIRNPGFDTDAVTHLTVPGASLSNDQVQQARKTAYEQLPHVLASARFAVIRKSEMAPRFIIDNRGFVPLYDEVAAQSGVLFPLTGNVAVMMVYEAAGPEDDYATAPFAELMLTADGAKAFHSATWNHQGIDLVIGHPDDASWIAELTDEAEAWLPRIGPYRGTAKTVLAWAA